MMWIRYPGLENFFSVSEQTELFWISCLCGPVIGVVFDCFRALRAIFPHNRLLVALEDCLFFSLYAVFLLCFSLTMARGELRWFYIAGNLLGFLVYYLTVGRIVLGILRCICKPIRRFFALICEKLRCFFVRVAKKSGKAEKSGKST
ncbi:MAG: spore cortex biosynthesis protein YabQ [Ruminococcus sp.]|nr:spore cortex biosynthesis protein YabQ [Ruminococcus sp.]